MKLEKHVLRNRSPSSGPKRAGVALTILILKSTCSAKRDVHLQALFYAQSSNVKTFQHSFTSFFKITNTYFIQL